MGNIIDYARNFIYSFEEKSFSDVDSLLLCLLSYTCYENLGMISKDDQYTFKELSIKKNNLFANSKLNISQSIELLDAAGQNPRFMNIFIQDYVSVLHEEQEMQFAAMTFVLNDHLSYIAFRGTDETLIGWKENINMALLPSVPSQREGVVYLDSIARKRDGQFFVGGHSKGGNIAVFSAASCTPNTQRRILTIFNHDGPGFPKSFIAQEGYRIISERVKKTLPEQSTVGLLLNHREPIFIVASDEEGINQHDGFSWNIQDGAFKMCDSLNRKTWLLANSINLRINTMNVEQLRTMVTALFEVIRLSDATTFEELTEALISRSQAVETVLGDLPPSTRGKFLTITKIIGSVFRS